MEYKRRINKYQFLKICHTYPTVFRQNRINITDNNEKQTSVSKDSKQRQKIPNGTFKAISKKNENVMAKKPTTQNTT